MTLESDNKYCISVIVPFYNSERTIGRCAGSLFSQTLPGIEYVFVDDGSTDDSVSVLKEVVAGFESRRGDVKIISLPENRGQAYARKVGLENAAGTYIIYCDSDDYVEPDMYRSMYEKAVREERDIVQCGYVMEKDGRVVSRWLFDELLFDDRKHLMSVLLLDKGLSSLWDKLVLRSLYYEVVFPEADIYEDFAIAVQLYHRCRSIGYIDKAFYHYVINAGSSLRPVSESRYNAFCEARVKNTEFICDFIVSAGLGEVYRDELIHLKLGARNSWIAHKECRNYKKWRETFPEVFPSLLVNKYVSLRVKAAMVYRMFLAKFFW